jgi:hypothetical protein
VTTAVDYYQPAVVRALIEAQADVDVQNKVTGSANGSMFTPS